ncbi:glycosyltransferase family 4 protein [Methylobacterium organophilum]|nr:glycosyltransferase family 4 protein [Methylobacterium organophilum]
MRAELRPLLARRGMIAMGAAVDGDRDAGSRFEPPREGGLDLGRDRGEEQRDAVPCGESDEPVELRTARDRVVVAPEQPNALAPRRDGIEGVVDGVEGRIRCREAAAPPALARYAALLTGRRWSFSAHAKDIWTTPDWELTEKLRDAEWGVTCTRDGLARLQALAPGRTQLAYHGLDLTRFPAPPPPRELRDGTDPDRALRLLCVGRLVAKKGHDDLIDALAALPAHLHWRLDLIGGGELRDALEARIAAGGLAERVRFRGALAQPAVIEAMRAADLFVLPTKPAPGGDRDGLPNVLMEAASQALPILATAFAGTPEFITDGVHGVLVPPGEPAALADALTRLAGDPGYRQRLGAAALARLVQDFSAEAAIALIAGRLRASAGLPRDAAAHEPELTACAS